MGLILLILLVTFGVLDYLAAIQNARQNLKDNIKNTMNFSRKHNIR